MKKAASIIIVAALTLALALSVSASTGTRDVRIGYRDIKITLDGEDVRPLDGNGEPVEPFILDGSTYLPVRGVASALGLDVGWDGETSTVILSTPEAEKQVYITRTGAKYHYDDSCNGGTYWPVPFDTATGMGLEPCEKCVLTLAHPEG